MSTNESGAMKKIPWSTPRIREFAPVGQHSEDRRHPDIQQYAVWALRARRQASEATTASARAIHLGIAEDYERKAGMR